jgi:long-subunit fatty acid transport protein
MPNEINLLTKTEKMKRKLMLSLSAAMLSASLMAGGIMTNTNQSAAYVRLLARNASLGIDGVYYNPAGLTKLENGFHLSLNNQTIFQTKDVVNNYPYLHGAPEAKFTGEVKAPVFPGVYAAYKVNKFAFSFGFNPVGGGGGATYATGLPSFEMPISDLIPKLGPGFGVTDYKADINFEGTSIYFGYQGGISYEINPAISLFAGLRYVTAKNTYKGSIKDIMIDPNYTTPALPTIPVLSQPDPLTFTGSFMRADAFGTQMNGYYSEASQYMTGVATYYTGVSTSYTNAAAGAGQLINAGMGALTYAQAYDAGYISAVQKAQFEGALTAAGQPVSTPIETSQVVYSTVATQATAGATQATAGAAQLGGGAAQMSALAAGTGDVEVDVVQKGTGFTPILGANLTLAEKLTIAIKYEFFTKIELTNETKVDGSGMFPDGEKSRADMPALLSIGASYPITSKLVASLGYNYYFDRSTNVDYGKKDESDNSIPTADLVDKNSFELALGLEYNITDKFLVSAGYLRAVTPVNEKYQDAMGYQLSSNTVGFGGRYKISPAIALNLGGLKTMYNDDSKDYTYMLGTTAIPVTENYSQSTWLVSVGVDITIGK